MELLEKTDDTQYSNSADVVDATVLIKRQWINPPITTTTTKTRGYITNAM